MVGHPPCEDVSWKVSMIFIVISFLCHPPCEDVSWKKKTKENPLPEPPSSSLWGCELKSRGPSFWWSSPVSSSLWGCELKNMWMIRSCRVRLSSSLWGCELKNCSFLAIHTRWCHPPCEDVSWKLNALCCFHLPCVILLVRMWVEKSFPYPFSRSSRSSSLWGCELKMENIQDMGVNIPSSSLWGCELKRSRRQNFSEPEKSSSLWGCELKNRTHDHEGSRQSHPPCEDVSWKSESQPFVARLKSHPPCEDVSWKF